MTDGSSSGASHSRDQASSNGMHGETGCEIRQLSASLEEVRQLLASLAWDVRKLVPEILTETQALQQLLGRYAPQEPLPNVSGWAMKPTGLVVLLSCVDSVKPGLVVELGAGTSTLWIARALKEQGSGRLISFEHQEQYAARYQRMLVAHGLDDCAEVRYTPLVNVDTPRGPRKWYDLDPGSIGGEIELLLVDGPPATTDEHARYPALPLLRRVLAAEAYVVVDDANRRAETEMIAFWQEEEPGLERLERDQNGLAVLRLTGMQRRIES
ncbi:MAG: class I SAM-dependent methyltransferase [Tessaracoccus sp.]|uniref:class I SAM-dependent methyltransferase n=1 Tax=Tessaracoccus sp. TaxID=1971211 RepID=UPI001ED65486|nr:class I SAM-dependent methyltransferase [Tessaracoccus sp.]MBK7820161.1 class I SAM-dependent methyltransferase [Tessaracoccus sp.]